MLRNDRGEMMAMMMMLMMLLLLQFDAANSTLHHHLHLDDFDDANWRHFGFWRCRCRRIVMPCCASMMMRLVRELLMLPLHSDDDEQME